MLKKFQKMEKYAIISKCMKIAWKSVNHVWFQMNLKIDLEELHTYFFFPVKAESPYFSMKMRFLVSETIGALYFSLKRINFLKKIENSEKSVFRG